MLTISSVALAQKDEIQVQEQSDQQPAQEPVPGSTQTAPIFNSNEQKAESRPHLYDVRHMLAGHAFLPAIAQPAAFADSRATLAVGLGQGSYSVNIGPATQKIDLIGLSPSFDVQVALGSRFAVFGGITTFIVTGLNEVSALVYGGSVRYAWNFGGLFEIIRSEDSVLSLAFQVNKPHTLAVSPLQSVTEGIQDVLAGISPNLVNSSVSTEYRPNLRFAHGFNPSLGVQVSLGADIRSTVESGATNNGTLVTGAIGLSSDLNPWISVPLGLTLNATRNQVITRSEQNSNAVSVGLWETFTHRFNMGVEVGWVRRGNVDSTIGAIVARDYFN
ncbi:MAG: hypothetical protein ACJ763_08400 [Bdellovibrionia bacterium]